MKKINDNFLLTRKSVFVISIMNKYFAMQSTESRACAFVVLIHTYQLKTYPPVGIFFLNHEVNVVPSNTAGPITVLTY